MTSDKLKVKFGYNISLQKFSPEIISYQSDSTSFVLNKDIFTNNFITEIYLEADIDLTEKLKASARFKSRKSVDRRQKLSRLTATFINALPGFRTSFGLSCRIRA
jgi:hypothetical protein